MTENIQENNTTEDKENLKYYKTLNSINASIIFVYSFLLILTFLLSEQYVFSLTGLFQLLVIFLLLELCYLIGWLIALPLRLWMYSICKKKGTLKQDLLSWLVDWLKVLGINMIFMLPLVAVALYILLERQLNPIVTFISFVILFFVLNTIRSYLMMALIHGVYRLENGEKYSYWKDLIVKNNITEYPVYVLKIAEKANFANAFAVGFKQSGFILTSDMLLQDMNNEQFASILAHETGHLVYNDILIRITGIGILLILLLFALNLITFFDWEILGYFILIMAIMVIAFVKITPGLVKKQEIRADLYAKNLIGSGKYLFEALEYLYNTNHVPKVLTKKEQKQIHHYHPLLEERKKILLDLE